MTNQITNRIMTNQEFAEINEHFRNICKKFDIEPTPTQAGKWRRRKGIAYKLAHNKITLPVVYRGRIILETDVIKDAM